MDCIDCDLEKLNENDCCPQCEKTLCPYCEDHMYDAEEKRKCEYCDEDRCQVCAGCISEGLHGLCRLSVTSGRILHPTLFLICFYGLF